MPATAKKPSAEKVAVQIECCREWRAWAKGLAASDGERAPLSTVLDRLLARRAKEIGYAPPPRR